MEDREAPQKHIYWERKRTPIIMTTALNVNSGAGSTNFSAA